MIYVLRVQNQKKGFLKVGTSRNILRRIHDIQTNCPFPLNLVSLRNGGAKEERLFHKKLKTYQTSGEWFEDNKETREILNLSIIHQDMKKNFSNQTDAFKLAVFMECNKEYSYEADILLKALKLNSEIIETYYHNKRFDSPFRLEWVSKEDSEKINLVGEAKSCRVISHPENFTPKLGGYDKFWQGPIRVTPFNKKNYPDLPLGARTW